MLYLLFQIGKNRYAIEARQAVEVLPFVDLEKIPPSLSAPSVPIQRPLGVAGIFNYRGQPVVAVDLSELTIGRPARELLSTRIIVVNLRLAPQARSPGSRVQSRGEGTQDSGLGTRDSGLTIGLIAERATGMMRREASDFVNAGLKVGEAPHLGPVLMDDQGVIQLLQAEQLLSDSVRAVILPETVGGDHAPGRQASER